MQVLQIAQHADDLDRAAAFYADLLGRAPAAVYDPPGLLFFTVHGVRVLLERNAPSAVHYFAVADLHATVERLRAAGTAVVSEPHVIFSHRDDTLGPTGSEEWQAFVRDSEANLVGLVGQRLSTASASQDDADSSSAGPAGSPRRS